MAEDQGLNAWSPGLARPLIALAVLASLWVLAALDGRLVVSGYAQTVDFDVTWSAASCAEYHTWPSLSPSGTDFGEYLGKDVGSNVVSGAPGATLTVAVNNGYPSYALKCTARYKSVGGYAVQAQTISLTPISGLTSCSVTGTEGDKAMSCAEFSVVLQGGLPSTCLQPGQEHELLLFAHVEQPSAQSSIMQYQVEVSFEQCQGVGGIQGCSPGYWKNHESQWDGVPQDLTSSVRSTDLFNATFGVTAGQSGLADSVTLIQALQPQTEGSTALSRYAASELANADSLGANHPYTVASVTALYRDAVGADAGPETIASATTKFEAAQDPTPGVSCPLN